MEIKTEAITKLLRQQIEKLDLSVDVTEVGEAVSYTHLTLPTILLV